MPKSKRRKRVRPTARTRPEPSVFLPTGQDILLLNQALTASCRGRPERALELLSRLSQPAPYEMCRDISEEMHCWREGTPSQLAWVLVRLAARWAAIMVPECGEYYAALFLCDCDEHSAAELNLLAMQVARADPLVHDLVLFEERLLEAFVDRFSSYWPRPEAAELLRRWADAPPVVALVSCSSDTRISVRDLVTGRVHELAARPQPGMPDTYHVGRLVPTDDDPPMMWALLPPQLTDVEAHRHARQIRDGVPAELRWANGATLLHTVHGDCPACLADAELAAQLPGVEIESHCLRRFANSDLVRSYLDRLDA